MFFSGKPERAVIYSDVTDLICNVSSTSKPEALRPPMGYVWIIQHDNERYNITTDDNVLPLPHQAANVSCYGMEHESKFLSGTSEVLALNKTGTYNIHA